MISFTKTKLSLCIKFKYFQCFKQHHDKLSVKIQMRRFWPFSKHSCQFCIIFYFFPNLFLPFFLISSWFFVRPSERVFEAIGWHNVVVHAIVMASTNVRDPLEVVLPFSGHEPLEVYSSSQPSTTTASCFSSALRKHGKLLQQAQQLSSYCLREQTQFLEGFHYYYPNG